MALLIRICREMSLTEAALSIEMQSFWKYRHGGKEQNKLVLVFFSWKNLF